MLHLSWVANPRAFRHCLCHLQNSGIKKELETRGTDSDGLPSAKKLEELKAKELGDQNFCSKVVPSGREFFDEMGTSCTEFELDSGLWRCHVKHRIIVCAYT